MRYAKKKMGKPYDDYFNEGELINLHGSVNEMGIVMYLTEKHKQPEESCSANLSKYKRKIDIGEVDWDSYSGHSFDHYNSQAPSPILGNRYLWLTEHELELIDPTNADQKNVLTRLED